LCPSSRWKQNGNIITALVVKLRINIILSLGLCFLIGCNGLEKSGVVTVSFAGDLLLDRGVEKQIQISGIQNLFSGITHLLKSCDYNTANLECPATEIQAPVIKKFVFNSDPGLLPHLKSFGLTHLVLANNHTYDQGRRGVQSTLNNLIKAGIEPIGLGSTNDKACSPVMISEHVAVFASVQMPLENWMFMPEEPGPCQSTISELCGKIDDFKGKNPDVYIIVTLHWGVEFQHTPYQQQRIDTRALINAGADIIIGHHPHVVQTIEFFKSKPIFYSIGNFIFDNKNPQTNKSIIVKLTIDRGTLVGIKLYPIKINMCRPALMEEPEKTDFLKEVLSFSPNITIKSEKDYWLTTGR
jgi:poly-gamma-glutamate synthesis protein (capsule biosynthesis protein)